MVSNWTISDPKEFSFLKINLHWEIQNHFQKNFWFFAEKFFRIFLVFFLKSREDFQQVENKYLEISKVWSYTEKILTKIIYAREAEQSIKDFYFDQVVELRQVLPSFWLAETADQWASWKTTQRRSFDSNSTEIGRNFHESDQLRQSNTESYNHAKALWTNMYKSVDRAKELRTVFTINISQIISSLELPLEPFDFFFNWKHKKSILEPMCNKLDKEWTEAGFQILHSDWSTGLVNRGKFENQNKSW